MARIYEDFEGFERFVAAENKAKQSQFIRAEYCVLRSAFNAWRLFKQSIDNKNGKSGVFPAETVLKL